MRNIKLILEYDGTDFSGWQEQPIKRTVQGELQKSLKQIFQDHIHVTAAGRTDAGVHALGQVANFHSNSVMSLSKMKAALNGTLPKDVRIIAIDDVPENFNARFDAQKREYHYQIALFERAILRNYCWYCKCDFGLDAMKQASAYLIGTYDFQSFCQSKAEVDHYLCDVESITWEKADDFVVLKIIANRFLHNMVRIIVGTVLNVGFGKIQPDDIKKILDSKDRTHAGPTVPAKGLCLVKVYY